MYQAPGKCPICGHDMVVSRLTCNHCNSKIEGEFTTCSFCHLDKEQWNFLVTFIKCRGNMKDMEKRINLSYPTLRNRLEAIISSLGLDDEPEVIEEPQNYMDILDALEKGSITAERASELFKIIEK